jgi:REP element-mobilizing transposase RayT
MPRARREDHEGAWHHVMNRGIDRATVFRNDDDRRIFFECLAAATHRYKLQVHAYCLLGNHFHLLLFSESGLLSGGMRFLLGRFTQRINYRDGRDGPIFRGRFASVTIEGDAHLVRASRYIHRNPIEAGLVREAWDWPWSSASAYIGLTAPPDWLATAAILEMFGAHRQQQEYRAFLEAEIDEPTRAIYKEWQD